MDVTSSVATFRRRSIAVTRALDLSRGEAAQRIERELSLQGFTVSRQIDAPVLAVRTQMQPPLENVDELGSRRSRQLWTTGIRRIEAKIEAGPPTELTLEADLRPLRRAWLVAPLLALVFCTFLALGALVSGFETFDLLAFPAGGLVLASGAVVGGRGLKGSHQDAAACLERVLDVVEMRPGS